MNTFDFLPHSVLYVSPLLNMVVALVVTMVTVETV